MSTPVELLHTFSIPACYAGGVHVLVIEDDPATAAGIVRGLKTARFEVALSVTGNDGARRILEDRPDAVVLDLMLPERNGFEVLERVHHRTSSWQLAFAREQRRGLRVTIRGACTGG
jgi:CheY-like chemotaxis protein